MSQRDPAVLKDTASHMKRRAGRTSSAALKDTASHMQRRNQPLGFLRLREDRLEKQMEYIKENLEYNI